MTQITTLGLVANGKRNIKSGSEYNSLFDSAEVKGNEIELMSEGTVYDTLKQMQKIVRNTLHQTKRISKKLEGSSREATCRNIFNFLYNHVQYKKDNALREQLRTPARTWKDRRSGVDCDCYSIFISSILTNLNIPHAFRMAGYQGDFQHVYVVVPKKGSTISAGYYTIDPVVSKFDYETPFNKKHDHMTKVTMLNGIGECSTKPIFDRLRRYVYADQVSEAGLIATEPFLKANAFQYQPIINEQTDGGAFNVQTNAGLIRVPTIITKQQAQSLLSAAPANPNNPNDPNECGCNKPKKNFWWGWVAIGAGALILLTGSDQSEVKPGLNGVKPKVKKKSKPKATTIHI